MRSFYNGKKVLVTGDTGFKGSWLSIWLKELGAEVTGYSLEPPSDPSNYEACRLGSAINHVHGDIRDQVKLSQSFDEFRPDIVFHLAAQAIVTESYKDPKLTFDTNVGGTVNIFEAVRKSSSTKVLINITSDKCYENKGWTWGYRENDALGGVDPYSASKACSELIHSSYLKSFFSGENSKGIASARTGNVIGGGDWGANRIIPDCVRSIVNNDPIGIRNPDSIRPWQHVLEPLSGYLWLGKLLWENPAKFSSSWNFGPSESACLPVREIVSRYVAFWGNGSWQEISSSVPLKEASVLKLCCDKARDLLNWRGILDINECLSFTSDWYKKFCSGKDESLYQFCCDQINQYTSIAKGKGLPWAN